MPLRVSLIQQPLLWEDPPGNRRQFAELCAPLRGQSDLIVLPEMFTTGFSMQSESLAEVEQGPSCEWMRALAIEMQAAVAGSVMTRTPRGCVNRLLFAAPDGQLAHYDKRHLFRMGQEHEHFLPGTKPVIVTWRSVRIALQICYDLRFPVWSRRRPDYDYDLLLYVANWPSARSFAWRQLLCARAIENQCFVVGVNRCGNDGNGVSHGGDSAVHDFLGATVASLGEQSCVSTVELDLPALQRFRERFPAHLDADRFTLLP
jgi:predicted amidohydrolase